MRLLSARIVVVGTLLGLALAVATLGVRSTELLHPSLWKPDQPADRSAFVEVAVWGWPLYFAVDHPYEGIRERIDSPGELRPWRLAIDVVFCVLLVLYVRALWVVSRHDDRSPQPIAAALLSPLTVFLVVQFLFPLFDLGGVSSIRGAILDASFGALLAAAAALAVLLLVGLPMTWVLRKIGRFRPKIVFGLGALLALFPVAGEITFDALTRPYYLGIFVLIAGAGGLCALTFWLFSGLAPSSTPA